MTRTMKAAVVREFKKPLSIEEVPVPEVGPGQILEDRSLGCLPYGLARGGRRLAGEAQPALHTGA